MNQAFCDDVAIGSDFDVGELRKRWLHKDLVEGIGGVVVVVISGDPRSALQRHQSQHGAHGCESLAATSRKWAASPNPLTPTTRSHGHSIWLRVWLDPTQVLCIHMGDIRDCISKEAVQRHLMYLSLVNK